MEPAVQGQLLEIQSRLNDACIHHFIYDLYRSTFTATSADLIALIEIALGKLTPKERAAIMLRYGLIDGRRRTYAEVAAILDCPVTAQTACNYVAKAKRRLRCHAWSADIRVCLQSLQETEEGG